MNPWEEMFTKRLWIGEGGIYHVILKVDFGPGFQGHADLACGYRDEYTGVWNMQLCTLSDLRIHGKRVCRACRKQYLATNKRVGNPK